ncbi:unnamed protein product [Peniophora sp. CBMAI 1063]|nr:unnamed protein product [Peniophora sp. CBMAI 1063]
MQPAMGYIRQREPSDTDGEAHVNMPIDPEEYTHWKRAQTSSSTAVDSDDERSVLGMSSNYDPLPSPTLIETASLLSDSTSRGSYHTCNKIDAAVTGRSSSQRTPSTIYIIILASVTGAGAVVGALSAPMSVRSALRMVGFRPGGIAKGSWAARWKSRIGDVAAGSLFSVAQAIMAGSSLPMSWYAAATLVGGLFAIGLYVMLFFLMRKWVDRRF